MIEIDADVIQPFSDQILICRIEYVSVVHQQNRCPGSQLSLRDQLKPTSIESVLNMLSRDDDAGLRQTKASGCRTPAQGATHGLQFKMNFEKTSQRAAEFVCIDLEQSETPQRIKLRCRQRR